MRQDRNFIIRINDFLKSTTISDDLTFKQKFSTKLPHITWWISSNIHLQRGDDETAFVTLTKTSYTWEYQCDRCWEKKEITRSLRDINLWCYADYPLHQLKEDEISFSSRDWRLDLEQTFIEEITLDEPIKQLCTNCQNLSSQLDEELPDDWPVHNGIVRK